MAEIEPADHAVGRRADRLAPEAGRVPPRMGLAPGQHAEAYRRDDDRRAHRRPEPAPLRPTPGRIQGDRHTTPAEHRKAQAGHVRVPIGREVIPERQGAGHGGEHDHIGPPGDEGAGAASAEQPREPRDQDDTRGGAQDCRVAQMEPGGRLVERREVNGHEQLDRVEPETDQDAGQGFLPRQELDGLEVAPEELPGEERLRHAQRGVRRLLGRDSQNRPDRQAPGGARKPPERIDVQEEQHERGGDRDRLRQERRQMSDHRRAQEPAAARAARGGRPNVGEDGQEKKQAGEDVPTLGRPGDGLDPQRMHREQQGRRRGARTDRARRERVRRGDERPRDRVESEGRGDVDQEAGQMIAGGIHSPDHVVRGEGEPCQRHEVPVVALGGHPPELRPAEPPVVGVLQEVPGVVPRDEAVPEHGQESQHRDSGERDRHPHVRPDPRSRSGRK